MKERSEVFVKLVVAPLIPNTITAGLSQEMDVPLDNNHIADARTHCHVFLDHIRNRRKPVQGLGNNRQE